MLEPSSHCRSVGLRLAAAVELYEASASDETLHLLGRMLKAVDATAEKLLDAYDDRAQQSRDADTLIEELRRLAARAEGEDLTLLVERLERRLAAHAQPSSHCLEDLEQICDFVAGQVRSLYECKTKAALESLPSPKITARCVRTDSSHAFFDQFGVNASTRVRARNIVVNIELKPDSLDIASAAQMLYLMAHETICHAYQSIEHAERINSDDTCGWTDGWMDALAWRLTERWIVREKSRLPDWLTMTPEESKRRCRKFHERRYEKHKALRDSDLTQRRLARTRFDTLYEAWERALPPGQDVEDHRATTFSVLLNHGFVEDDVRRKLMVALTKALDTRTSRSDDAVGLCSDFIIHRDAHQLLENLEALNSLPVRT